MPTPIPCWECTKWRKTEKNAWLYVVDANTRRLKYPMERIHEDGFFEVIIPDREEWFRYRLECTDYQGNSWHTYDPYAFSPTISEYDRYLFGEGNH